MSLTVWPGDGSPAGDIGDEAPVVLAAEALEGGSDAAHPNTGLAICTVCTLSTVRFVRRSRDGADTGVSFFFARVRIIQAGNIRIGVNTA